MSWVKDPVETLDYQFDWSKWLTTSEVISTATFTVADSLTKGATSHDNTTATLWLSGGMASVNYEITCTITTNQGRTGERTQLLAVQQR